MRRVVTGVDADGRSTVLDDGPPPVAFEARSMMSISRVDGRAATVPSGGAVVHQLWALTDEPRRGIADPTLAMEQPDFDTQPRATSWIVTEMSPGGGAPMHDTPTVDYGLVLAGEVELGLETGPVVLHAGDAVLVDGVQHSWRAGPEGCVIATVQVGLPRDR